MKPAGYVLAIFSAALFIAALVRLMATLPAGDWVSPPWFWAAGSGRRAS